jgi:hypothetical protein
MEQYRSITNDMGGAMGQISWEWQEPTTRVTKKSFQVRDLIWKMILPIGSKSNKFRKWSPNWEGPYRIEEVIPRNLYMFQSVQGTSLPSVLNGKYLKKYYPGVSQDA